MLVENVPIAHWFCVFQNSPKLWQERTVLWTIIVKTATSGTSIHRANFLEGGMPILNKIKMARTVFMEKEFISENTHTHKKYNRSNTLSDKIF